MTVRVTARVPPREARLPGPHLHGLANGVHHAPQFVVVRVAHTDPGVGHVAAVHTLGEAVRRARVEGQPIPVEVTETLTPSRLPL